MAPARRRTTQFRLPPGPHRPHSGPGKVVAPQRGIGLMALVDEAETLRSSAEADRNRQPATGVALVLSVADAAEALGVSDDLVYELIARGELPCLALGRRKLIRRLAIELLVETAMKGFEPDIVLAVLSRRSTAPPGTPC